MEPKKWARVRKTGAHGLRRGAWYPVVNDARTDLVVLDVNKKNIPVPRDLLEVRDGRPALWSVVEWQTQQRGASRAAKANAGPVYAVCPSCKTRSRLEPQDAQEMVCPKCGGDFGVDWATSC